MPEPKTLEKDIELIPDEQEFYVWVYSLDDSGALFTTSVTKSKEDAMKYPPSKYHRRALVKFTVSTDELSLR